MKKSIALILTLLLLLPTVLTGCGVADKETEEGLDATFDFIEEGLEVIFAELPEAFKGMMDMALEEADNKDLSFEKIIAQIFNSLSNELSFELNEDGTEYTVVGIGGYDSRHLEIPSEWEGLPVTKIGSSAFSGTNIKSVKIPDSITSIESSAFSNCIYLEEVALPDSVTYIGEYAFSKCEDLEYVYIPEGVTSIGDSAFWYCVKLTDVTLPSTVAYLGSLIFYGCDNLSHVSYNGTAEEWNSIEVRPEGIAKKVVFLEK